MFVHQYLSNLCKVYKNPFTYIYKQTCPKYLYSLNTLQRPKFQSTNKFATDKHWKNYHIYQHLISVKLNDTLKVRTIQRHSIKNPGCPQSTNSLIHTHHRNRARKITIGQHEVPSNRFGFSHCSCLLRLYQR